MNKFIAALTLIAALVTGCQSGGHRGSEKDPGLFDGTYEAQVTRDLVDSNGVEEHNDWSAIVTLDQKELGVDYWGVIASVEGDQVDFGSKVYTVGAFWYDSQEYNGGGSKLFTKLDIDGEAADASGNVFYTYTAKWTLTWGQEYFADGWEDAPPMNFANGGPLVGVTLPEFHRSLIEPRIRSAFEASR